MVWWHHMATRIWVTIGSGNDLLPDSTKQKPLPAPMLTYHQRGSVALTWGQFFLEVLIIIHNMSLKITLLKLQTHLPGSNESKSVEVWQLYSWLQIRWWKCLAVMASCPPTTRPINHISLLWNSPEHQISRKKVRKSYYGLCLIQRSTYGNDVEIEAIWRGHIYPFYAEYVWGNICTKN